LALKKTTKIQFLIKQKPHGILLLESNFSFISKVTVNKKIVIQKPAGLFLNLISV
jgi:hypothetical protein